MVILVLSARLIDRVMVDGRAIAAAVVAELPRDNAGRGVNCSSDSSSDSSNGVVWRGLENAGSKLGFETDNMF